METELEIIEGIKNHVLGNSEEAFSLYLLFCNHLKEKYGWVDKDYDDNPTKRGKEWLEIHHILEYKLDDIAKRTERARNIEKLRKQADDEILVISTAEFNDDKKREEIAKKHFNSTICTLDYSFEELKPYNVKEQLVYANKIEHFLLHYLIDSIRGKEVFSGGPNYLWDGSVALDIYGFEQEYMNALQNEKEKYYSILSSEEITWLYKKLIDWKNWELQRCVLHWTNYKSILRSIREKGVSYIKDTEKFFKIFNILGCEFTQKDKQYILSLPYRAKIVKLKNCEVKEINYNFYSLDEKTILSFGRIYELKSFSVPSKVERISEDAFRWGVNLETITIPETIREIEDRTFIKYKNDGITRCCPKLKKIIYKGTQEEWDCHFSNVELEGIKLVCKKNRIKLESKHSFKKEIIGKWRIGDSSDFFTIKKSDIEDKYLIKFKEYETKISYLSPVKFSFSYTNKKDNTSSTCYIFLVQGEAMTALVLAKNMELSKAVDNDEYIFCTSVNEDTMSK